LNALAKRTGFSGTVHPDGQLENSFDADYGNQEGDRKMKWEYRYVQVSDQNPGNMQLMVAELNELGLEGWEAVSTVPKTPVAAHYVLLKRPAK